MFLHDCMNYSCMKETKNTQGFEQFCLRKIVDKIYSIRKSKNMLSHYYEIAELRLNIDYSDSGKAIRKSYIDY